MTTEWFDLKLQQLTQAYLEGHGSTVIFESQYLCYLECRTALLLGEEAANRVWSDYVNERGDPPTPLYRTNAPRTEVVSILEKFTHRYNLPLCKPAIPHIPPMETDLWEILRGFDDE